MGNGAITFKWLKESVTNAGEFIEVAGAQTTNNRYLPIGDLSAVGIYKVEVYDTAEKPGRICVSSPVEVFPDVPGRDFLGTWTMSAASIAMWNPSGTPGNNGYDATLLGRHRENLTITPTKFRLDSTWGGLAPDSYSDAEDAAAAFEYVEYRITSWTASSQAGYDVAYSLSVTCDYREGSTTIKKNKGYNAAYTDFKLCGKYSPGGITIVSLYRTGQGGVNMIGDPVSNTAREYIRDSAK